jgi:tetratricopeptide (TPR) repeat protein
VVGRLTAWLRANGQLERTLLVVTADHGESLGDHGEGAHAYFIYGATTHVPLLVRTPWGLTGRNPSRVSGVDLMPTVLELVGLPPEPGLDGRSVARALFDPQAALGHAAYSETYFPRYHFGWQQLRGLRDDRWSYIDAPEPELYDLAADPGEAKNVFKSESAHAETLRVAMERLAQSASGRRPGAPEPRPRHAAAPGGARLRRQRHRRGPDGGAARPKHKLRLFEMMNAAKAHAQEDRLDAAIALMRKVTAEDANIVDAHLTLGNWLLKARDPEGAIASYREALARKPDDEISLGNLAQLYRARGRTEDELAALEVFRTALRVNPKNPQSLVPAGDALPRRGPAGRRVRGVRRRARGEPEAGRRLERAGGDRVRARRPGARRGDGAPRIALEPGVRTARYNLGRIREARGDAAGAEALYREELATYADNGRAWFNLAQLRRAQGDRDGYLATLRTAIEKAPDFGASYWYLAREELLAGRLDAAKDLAQRGLAAQPCPTWRRSATTCWRTSTTGRAGLRTRAPRSRKPSGWRRGRAAAAAAVSRLFGEAPRLPRRTRSTLDRRAASAGSAHDQDRVEAAPRAGAVGRAGRGRRARRPVGGARAGRCLRRVLVCDAGPKRNQASGALHGFLSRDGFRRASCCASRAPSSRRTRRSCQRAVRVRAVERRGLLFSAALAGGRRVTARCVLLATGVADDLPGWKGLRRFYGRGVFHCPYCDAYEVRGRRIAVWGETAAAAGLAVKLRSFSPDVVLLTGGAYALSARRRATLRAQGVKVLEAPVAALAGKGPRARTRPLRGRHGAPLRRGLPVGPLPAGVRPRLAPGLPLRQGDRGGREARRRHRGSGPLRGRGRLDRLADGGGRRRRGRARRHRDQRGPVAGRRGSEDRLPKSAQGLDLTNAGAFTVHRFSRSHSLRKRRPVRKREGGTVRRCLPTSCASRHTAAPAWWTSSTASWTRDC